MSIGEVPSTLGQSVHMRGLGLRVPTHEAHPVIEVIDGNEQDVGLFISNSMGKRKYQ